MFQRRKRRDNDQGITDDKDIMKTYDMDKEINTSPECKEESKDSSKSGAA